MSEGRYAAARIEAEVTVDAYEKVEDADSTYRTPARRTVKLHLNEAFRTDDELDVAIDAFAACIREAARR